MDCVPDTDLPDVEFPLQNCDAMVDDWDSPLDFEDNMQILHDTATTSSGVLMGDHGPLESIPAGDDSESDDQQYVCLCMALRTYI